MTTDEIRDALSRCYSLDWKVSDNKHISLPDRGFCAKEPFQDEEGVQAIALLLMKRYEHRKRITIGALTIKPDLSAPTQEELFPKVGEGTIWSIWWRTER